jgi:hypothetical protein
VGKDVKIFLYKDLWKSFRKAEFMIGRGIFHGIGTYTNQNGIEITGLFRPIYNRAG